jgi:hypothetical protein
MKYGIDRGLSTQIRFCGPVTGGGFRRAKHAEMLKKQRRFAERSGSPAKSR